MASFAAGDLLQTLDAYELALALEPASMKARFNFAIALDQAGYPRDAANELEKLLDANPTQTPPISIWAIYARTNCGSVRRRGRAICGSWSLDPQHPQRSHGDPLLAGSRP